MGCLKSSVKYSLFGINLIFTLLGLAITIATIVIYLKYQDEYESYFKDSMKFGIDWLPIAFGVIGISMFIIAFCGCWGAVTGNKFFLILFITLMLPLIVGKLFLVIVYRNVEKVERVAETRLEEMFRSKTDISFHFVELSLHCCGIKMFGPDSYREYGKMKKFGFAERVLPLTCCSEKITDFNELTVLLKTMMDPTESMKNEEYDPMPCTVSSEDVHKDSCSTKVRGLIKYYGKILMITLAATTGLEIVEALAATFLVIAKKRTSRKEYY